MERNAATKFRQFKLSDVAVAPTHPECDEAALRATLGAVAEVEPVTIFHERINIRAEYVERIEAHAKALGLFPPLLLDRGEGRGDESKFNNPHRRVRNARALARLR